jgi:O-antigen ligase
LLVAPLLILSPNTPLQRILHPGAGETISTHYHELLFFDGIKVFAEHPFVGVGLGNFKRTMDLMGVNVRHGGYIAHDVYIEYAAELGIAGLLLFLAIVVSTYRSLARIRKEAIKRDDELYFAITSGMQTGLVGFCVASMFLSAEYQKTFWILIFLSACMPALFRSRHLAGPRLPRLEDVGDPASQTSCEDDHESDLASVTFERI